MGTKKFFYFNHNIVFLLRKKCNGVNLNLAYGGGDASDAAQFFESGMLRIFVVQRADGIVSTDVRDGKRVRRRRTSLHALSPKRVHVAHVVVP